MDLKKKWTVTKTENKEIIKKVPVKERNECNEKE